MQYVVMFYNIFIICVYCMTIKNLFSLVISYLAKEWTRIAYVASSKKKVTSQTLDSYPPKSLLL